MDNPNILLFAKNGQLGWELQRTLLPLGNLTAVGSSEADFERPETIVELIRQIKPVCIVNSAAYTAVDLAETEKDRAYKINAVTPGILAEEAKHLNALLIHFSTDYVFDGRKGKPYNEKDIPNPLNVYGSSKLEGERAVQTVDGDYLIIRTSWVYSLRNQSGFVNKVLNWSRHHSELRIVTDQIGSPTWAGRLAEITSEVLSRGVGYLAEHRGLYHVAGEGTASRFEWAQSILDFDIKEQGQKAKEILSATTEEFPTPAIRPLFSALECLHFENIFKMKIPDWRSDLKLAMSL